MNSMAQRDEHYFTGFPCVKGDHKAARRVNDGSCIECPPRPTKRHGMTDTLEYRSWAGAKGRCFNPNNPKFNRYGGRGITMCQAWADSFEEFYRYMGDKPSQKHSLDRWPNPDGNYKPGNCRWATTYQQRINQIIHPRHRSLT